MKSGHRFVIVQSLSHIWHFAISWAAACQASLSFTNSQVYSNSCPSGQWYYLTILSSATFSCCLQSFPASGSFPMSWLFISDCQTIGASASALASVFPMNIQGWFLLDPWFMDLTFQVPMQYCSLQHWSFITRHIHNWTSFVLWANCFILYGAISNWLPLFPSNILDTFQPGGLMFHGHIFLPFHTVHRVLVARTLEWVAISFSSGPCFVRTLHYDSAILGSPAQQGYTSPLAMTRLWYMKGRGTDLVGF